MFRSVAALAVLPLLSCGGELDAPLRACQLSKANVHVVDLAGTEIDLMYALMSDGTLRWWGDGYPVSEYDDVAEKFDEPCLTAIDMTSSRHAALSYRDSMTLLYYDPFRFRLGAQPATLPPPSDSQLVTLLAGNDFLALDGAGAVWVLWQESTEVGHAATDTFVRLALPQPAVQITSNVGYCAVLTDGSAWCQDYFMEEELGRYGMGEDPNVKELTRLPVEDAKLLVLDDEFSCYLDGAGTTRCAGSNRGMVLGYDSSQIQEGRPSFEIVPGLPPLKKLWSRFAGVCGQSLEDDLWCWGGNVFENLVPSETQENILPTKVGSFPGMKDLALSDYTTCVLRDDNKVVCRGASASEEILSNCGEEDGWRIMAITPCDEDGASP